MKADKFQVINLTKELIVSVENYLTNFPKSEIELKKNIRNSSYDMLLIAYEANVTNDSEIRKQLIDKMIAKIKYVDFLINLCYDKKIINGKKYKSKLERKNLVPSDVIKDAIQIGRGEYIKLTSHDKVVFKLVKSKNKYCVELHSGENNIYVYSGKLKIEHI